MERGSFRNCPICGGENVELDFRGKSSRASWNDEQIWTVAICAACHHGFIDPLLSYDELSPFYEETYFETRTTSAGRYEKEVEEGRKTGRLRHVEIRPGMRLLDVGAGQGEFAAGAAALGAVVQAVEPSTAAVEICRANGVNAFHGDLTAFLAEPLEEPFDLVTTAHVIEHHPDPITMVREMASALKPGGLLWIAAPNAAAPTARAAGLNWHSMDLPIHLHHFTLTSMHRLLNEAGLKIERIETSSDDSLPGVSARILKDWLGLPPRLTTPFLRRSLKRSARLGAAIDAHRFGEAILATARKPE